LRRHLIDVLTRIAGLGEGEGADTCIEIAPDEGQFDPYNFNLFWERIVRGRRTTEELLAGLAPVPPGLIPVRCDEDED
jgi:hypothetical protein